MSRTRTKNCDQCQTAAEIMYRVQIDRSGQWQFVCSDCWPLLCPDNPNYVYGGTWKSQK